ncbi:hypothetical protein [Nocardia stercoris]|uniref:Uncharacterized protein n=1 Tax=Nocardia stercoris TaxID=2483361 RepID=A0A3M2LEZ1_9NOCA|nr:hypothetical protein [Nocardia stercoris]RMI33268.1 hypothetical protein EBN03_08780 [Nocardia stercoris]
MFGFVLEDITIGRFAHGFGTAHDGRPFAFRTVGSTLTVEIYRADLDTPVPAATDIVAVATAPVTDIDLDDERSVTALVRDLIPTATPVVSGNNTVRTLLERLSGL